MSIDERIYVNRWKVYKDNHLKLDPEKCKVCEHKPCTYCCPVEVYNWENEEIVVSYEGCLECGTCEIVCPYKKITLTYPVAGHGIVYRFG